MQFGDVQILQILDLTLYRIVVNGTNADFTSDASATLAEILVGLTAAVNVMGEPVSGRVVGSDRVFILPDVVTATHAYSVNVPANLGLTVGFQSTLPVTTSKSASLIRGVDPTPGVVHRSIQARFGWRSRFVNP